MKKAAKIWHVEIEEFAHEILGLKDDFDGDISDELEEKFECSFNTFHKIVEAIAPYTMTHVSPLTKRHHKGFVADGHFVLKYEVDQDGNQK